MPKLDQFIESLTHEKENIINMGIIKGSNGHALDMHASNNICNLKTKKKGKGKAHAEPRKQGKTKCIYCNHCYHPEFACMKKHIYLMGYILQKNNLIDHIPEATNNKLKDQAKQGNSHALISINSSLDAWILDLGPTLVKVIRQGRLEIVHNSFENVLRVPKLSVNRVSIY
jgi:hypothetical protein